MEDNVLKITTIEASNKDLLDSFISESGKVFEETGKVSKIIVTDLDEKYYANCSNVIYENYVEFDHEDGKNHLCSWFNKRFFDAIGYDYMKFNG